MDEMKIKSFWMRGVISNEIRKLLKKKFGCDIDIHLNDLEVSVIDGNLQAHLDTYLEIEKQELTKLLK